MTASPPADEAALAELLRWYADMGVDRALDEVPRNSFAEKAPADAPAPDAVATADPSPPSRATLSPATPSPVTPARVVAAVPVDAAAASARTLAAAATTLEELRASLDSFEGCGLRFTATRLVFSDGDPSSRVMLIGEAPGADEDRAGRPFVGRAGQLLDRMLAAIGLDRSQVYIANVVPWRPPGNRTPTAQETTICLPFTLRQIALARCDIVVCLGGSATATLLGTKEGIMRARGRWRELELGTRTVRVLPTLHPAFLLRSPAQKRAAWQDLRALRLALDAPRAD
jgi:DNA polymerase